MKKILFFIVATTVSLTSCAQQNVKEREGEPDIYNTDSDDKEMNEAIKKSRATFKEFTAAFDSKKRTQSYFSVKMPFPTEDGAEHIWLSGVTKIDGEFYGKIDNLPEEITSVKLGQTIEIDPSKISDWFYVDNGKLVGGLTIRVIRDRMTPIERKQLDQDLGVTKN
jgi:uncharacterized protein YegJ (DUF2314 family)